MRNSMILAEGKALVSGIFSEFTSVKRRVK